MTNLEQQLFKILKSSNRFLDNDDYECPTNAFKISKIRWNIEKYLSKLFNVDYVKIKDGEKKAIFNVFGKKNYRLANSINQLLKGYNYDVFKIQKINKKKEVSHFVLEILVNEDGYKKGIQIIVNDL